MSGNEISDLIYTGEAGGVPEETEGHDEAGSSALKEELQNRRKRLIKLGAMTAFSVIILVFSTIAWFTASREVKGTGAQMTAEGLDFELRSAGSDLGAEVYSVSGADSAIKDGSPVSSAFQTDGSSGKIKWRLGSSGGGALRPSSSGILSFEVIPKKTGPLEITFSFDIEGYTAVQTKTGEETYDVSSLTMVTPESDQKLKDAVRYLNGRILFFAHENNVGLLDPKGFTLSEVKGETVNAEENVPITVTVYWVWPNTYSQMVLAPEDDPSGGEPVSADEATLDKLRSYVVSHRADLFTDQLSDGTALTDGQLAGKLAVKNGDEWVFDPATAKAPANVTDMSYLYNSADQMIGLNLQYALLTMSAE